MWLQYHKLQSYRWSVRYVLSEIRLNHAQTNNIITVGIAISPAPVWKKSPYQGVVIISGAFALTSVRIFPTCSL